jgi:membrane dipeptidase
VQSIARLPWELRTKHGGSFDTLDIAREQPAVNTDIPRLRRGGVGGQFWSVYVPYETAKRGQALQTTLEQIQLVRTIESPVRARSPR